MTMVAKWDTLDDVVLEIRGYTYGNNHADSWDFDLTQVEAVARIKRFMEERYGIREEG